MENDPLTPAKAIKIAVDKSRQFDETRKLLANLRKSISQNILKDLHDTFNDPEVSAESIVDFLNRIKNYKTLASKASDEVKKELYQSIEESLKMLFHIYVGISPKEDLEVLFEEYTIECLNQFTEKFEKGKIIQKNFPCHILYSSYYFRDEQFQLEYENYTSGDWQLEDFDFLIYYGTWSKERQFYDVEITVPDFISIIQSILLIE